jgi:hypothetical protein
VNRLAIFVPIGEPMPEQGSGPGPPEQVPVVVSTAGQASVAVNLSVR